MENYTSQGNFKFFINKKYDDERMKENLNSLTFKLSDDDVKEMSKLNINLRFNQTNVFDSFDKTDIMG